MSLKKKQKRAFFFRLDKMNKILPPFEGNLSENCQNSKTPIEIHVVVCDDTAH